MEKSGYHNAPACVWMQAGVVQKKHCFKEFSCTVCRFDKALRRVCRENEDKKAKGEALTGPKGKLVHWMDKLRKKPLSQRPCVHHMKGQIRFKNCPKSYHCIDCEFDQYFHDQFKVHTDIQPVDFRQVSGFRLPTGYYLHPGHTWLKIEDNHTVRIGIDDFSARILGPPTALDLPLMGRQVNAGENTIVLARQGHTAGFPAPVSGVVLDVNNEVLKDTARVCDDPYTRGWLFTLYAPNLKQELGRLMFMTDCQAFLGKKAGLLNTFLEDNTGRAAADGGEIAPDLYGNLPGDFWDDLVNGIIQRSV